jgi:NCAIR mutase (PurE)-related protein
MAERDIKLDTERRERLGFDEAILCAGKSTEHLTAILEQAGGGSLLLTRLDADDLKSLPPALSEKIDYEPLSRCGYFGKVAAPGGEAEIAIVTAGTSDVRVSREAARTLAYYGAPSLEVSDVGVAGLWRLMERIEEIKRHRIVIAVAGLDAALPSVIGGLVPGLVIAVPTSTGYGAARGGETALFSSLVSCAPGVVVVNIDNGYGAACAALRALRGGG